MAKSKTTALQAVDPKQLNTAVILANFEKEAKPLKAKLNKLQSIKTKEEFELAGTTLKQLKALAKQANEKLDSFTKPLDKLKKDVKDLFSPFLTNIARTDVIIKEIMLNFLKQQDEKALRSAAKLENGSIKVGTYHQQISELAVEVEGISVRSKQILEIKNPKSLPPKYLIPNEKLIREDLLKGKVIKGCKLVEQKVLAI